LELVELDSTAEEEEELFFTGLPALEDDDASGGFLAQAMQCWLE